MTSNPRRHHRRISGQVVITLLLSAGNRPGASVARCVGDGDGAKQSVVDFSVYCSKLLAGIDTGRLPDTISDRANKIDMKRKTMGEPVERFYLRDVEPIADPLRERLAAWAQSNMRQLADARPELPSELDDRAGSRSPITLEVTGRPAPGPRRSR
jgi:Protein of unknown function (DUF3631)